MTGSTFTFAPERKAFANLLARQSEGQEVEQDKEEEEEDVHYTKKRMKQMNAGIFHQVTSCITLWHRMGAVG